MSNTFTAFTHEDFDIKGATCIDNSPILLVYMVKKGRKLVETARFDLGKALFIDPPFGIISDENVQNLLKITKNVIRK